MSHLRDVKKIILFSLFHINYIVGPLTRFILDTGKQVLWHTMKTQDEMHNNVAVHQGLHCLQR